MSDISPSLVGRMQIKPTLRDCERAIERAAVAYAQAGAALAMIRDKRLYKEEHATFDEYCQKRWKLQKSQVYRQIDAAAVYDTLADKAETSPMGEVFEPPRNERTARELVPLRGKPAQLTKVWQRVVEQHGPDAKASQVRAVVAEILPPANSPSTAPKPRSVGDAVAALKRLVTKGYDLGLLREALDEIDRGGTGDARA